MSSPLTLLTIPTALIISSLVIGYALLENGRNNRYKLIAPSHSPKSVLKIDLYTGRVEICRTSFSQKGYESLNEKIYSVTCGEFLHLAAQQELGAGP